MTIPAAAARAEAASKFRPSFFFWMTLAMCFFVFGGFGLTYLFPMTTDTFPPAPPGAAPIPRFEKTGSGQKVDSIEGNCSNLHLAPEESTRLADVEEVACV